MADGGQKKPTWSVELEKKLTEYYQEHQELWDPKHPEYFNRVTRDSLLSTLINIIGVAANGVSFKVKDIKEKFKNLRTTYGREIKKIEESKKSGAGAADIYHPRWTNFNSLEFLRESMKAGPSRDTLQKQNNQETGDDTLPLEGSSVTASAPTKSPPRKRKNHAPSSRQFLMEEAVRVLATPDPPADGEDFFAKHVAASLRRLAPFQKEHAKLEIQQVLLKYCATED